MGRVRREGGERGELGERGRLRREGGERGQLGKRGRRGRGEGRRKAERGKEEEEEQGER